MAAPSGYIYGEVSDVSADRLRTMAAELQAAAEVLDRITRPLQ